MNLYQIRQEQVCGIIAARNEEEAKDMAWELLYKFRPTIISYIVEKIADNCTFIVPGVVCKNPSAIQIFR